MWRKHVGVIDFSAFACCAFLCAVAVYINMFF